ncbi:conserved hypothetical protein, membrane [Candidatus Magnetobacterium bavaricum]|uniref:DUF2304 domain-containing protein n=1 Tax=Candidatus Magnetobacterium bavaricum TaxID=29290 RepID=A0A0F3GXK6_9BACT|nr:conserved hypothetical protein, membrane [Candidatus Magnetobacterium bavaricum]
MSLGARIFIICLGIFIFGLVFELVRRKRFREELSILWFVVAFCIIAGAFSDILINPLAKLLGIGYPPIMILVLLVVLLILSLLYFSVVISDLKGRLKELTQKTAFLEYELKSVKKNSQKKPHKTEHS